MGRRAPEELIRRIEAELRSEYAAERGLRTLVGAPAQPRRRWPMLLGAAALLLVGVLLGQVLTIRTSTTNLAVTVPNAADPGSATVVTVDGGAAIEFGAPAAAAAPLDELALALLEAPESPLAYVGAADPLDGELGPGPYAVGGLLLVIAEPGPDEPNEIETETVTSTVDGSARMRVFEDGSLTSELIVDNSERFDAWLEWPVDGETLLADLVERHAAESHPEIAAALEALDVLRSPLAPNSVRATAWLAIGQVDTIEISEVLGDQVLVSIPIEGGIMVADVYADLRTGRVDRVEERWGDGHPDAGAVRTTQWSSPPVLSTDLPE